MMKKRDLKADLELCNKATPGPWYAGVTDDERFMNLHYVTTEPRSYRHDGERAFVEGLIRRDKVVAITLLQTPRFVDCWQFGENTRFIAQAREGWPHAIERAIKAESLVRELVGVIDEFCRQINQCGFDEQMWEVYRTAKEVLEDD